MKKKIHVHDGLMMHISISGTSETLINTMLNLLILKRYTLRGKITWKQTKFSIILLLDIYTVTVTMLTACLGLSVKTVRVNDLNWAQAQRETGSIARSVAVALTTCLVSLQEANVQCVSYIFPLEVLFTEIF